MLLQRIWRLLTFWRQPLLNDDMADFIGDIVRAFYEDDLMIDPIFRRTQRPAPAALPSRAPNVPSQVEPSPPKRTTEEFARFVIRSKEVGTFVFPDNTPKNIPPDIVGDTFQNGDTLPLSYLFLKLDHPHVLNAIWGERKVYTKTEDQYKRIDDFSVIRITASHLPELPEDYDGDISKWEINTQWGDALFEVEIIE